MLTTLLGLLGLGTYSLWEPALNWMDRVPVGLSRLERSIREFKKPVEQVSDATEQVEKITSLEGPRKAPTIELKKPGLAEVAVGQARTFLVEAVLTLVLLYLMLASDGLFARKLFNLFRPAGEKQLAAEMLGRIERGISNYLRTVTLINTLLGISVGLAMYVLGMPSPALWGAMVGLLNFVPYLGALASLLILLVAAALTFESLARVFLVGAVYLALTSVEGTLITPLLLGRRMAINPVAVFIGLIFWGWAWGIAGALIAVPLLVMTMSSP